MRGGRWGDLIKGWYSTASYLVKGTTIKVQQWAQPPTMCGDWVFDKIFENDT